MAGINAISIPVFNLTQQLDHVITCIGTEDQLPEGQIQTSN